MTRWSRLRAALDNLAHKGRAEADLDEEVRECAEMLADAKRAVRNLLHTPRDPQAMELTVANRLQNQQIERALQKICLAFSQSQLLSKDDMTILYVLAECQ
jgi:hypothetical protein